jgi:hypothetical protein
MRLFHPIEEMACLAAVEALAHAGIDIPVGAEDVGLCLGVEEGVDGIKARFFRGVLADGPLGASPLAFPFTAPNAIAARLSILLDLRGETLTVCGGQVSGAHAVGLGIAAVRAGRARMVLAGGATSIDPEFLDALLQLGRPDGGSPRCGACLLALERGASPGSRLVGYGEGVGRAAIPDAIHACLADATLCPASVRTIRIAGGDPRQARTELRQLFGNVPVRRARGADFHSAAFPMALAEAAGHARAGEPILVVGEDCLAGAAAALIMAGDS